MTKRLRNHQKDALRYTLNVKHPALFMQMRLGKTLVALRRLSMLQPMNELGGLRVLVVAPSSALGGWEEQGNEEGWSITWLIGNKDERRKKLTLLSEGLHLINKEGWIALPEIKDYPWDAVVADESTFLKNPSPKVTKFFIRNFRDVQMRMILTGTPNPEGAENFYCQFAFLYGMAFGCKDYWAFRMKFMQPHPAGFGWVLKPGAKDTLLREVGRRACVMRRSDVGYAEQRVYEKRTFIMPPKLRKAYDKLEKEFEIEWKKKQISTKWTGSKYQWLRQMCGGIIDGDLVWGDKVTEVISLLQGELKNEKLVVWCNYNAEVEVLRKALDHAKISTVAMTGKTKLSDRNVIRKKFHTKKNPQVLVLQQAIAQTGMDLSKADTAIYYSTPLGGFARAQTEDRILSIEKIEKGTPMLFIDLVTEGTVDEDAMELIKDKKQNSDISYSRALGRAMKERLSWTRSM